jgi:hypothetical protein
VRRESLQTVTHEELTNSHKFFIVGISISGAWLFQCICWVHRSKLSARPFSDGLKSCKLFNRKTEYFSIMSSPSTATALGFCDLRETLHDLLDGDADITGSFSDLGRPRTARTEAWQPSMKHFVVYDSCTGNMQAGVAELNNYGNPQKTFIIGDLPM